MWCTIVTMNLLHQALRLLPLQFGGGLTLRILRDNASLTRQAYVEFDLETMFDLLEENPEVKGYAVLHIDPERVLQASSPQEPNAVRSAAPHRAASRWDSATRAGSRSSPSDR